MPKVSVVTGFYNRGSLLERTVTSILSQSYTDLELIVFDDNSSDDTVQRLQALDVSLDDPRFRYVIHPVNRGFVRGLKDAIAISTGDYIAIQGSGDVSLPDRLLKQVELLDKRPEVGAVGCWYFNIQENQNTRRLRKPDAEKLSFSELLETNVYSHGEVMIRRSAYEQVGGYRTVFKYAQDRDLWLRIAKVAKLATVPEPLYLRYVQFDGVSYVPSKVLSQTCFSLSAARLAQMSEAEQADALERIEREGPSAIVPVDDRLAQKKIINASLRMILFGAPNSGKELARSGIASALVRGLVLALASLYNWRVFRPIVPLILKAAGIRS